MLLLQTVQYITVSVLFAEVLIVFLKWSNTIHSYLFIACIASLINNLGYLFELKARSEEACITALKLSYSGRVWIVLFLFLFAAKMCRKKIPKAVAAALLLTYTGVYVSVLGIGSSSLYYKTYQYIPDPLFPKLFHENGNVHDLFMGLNAVLGIIAFVWIIREYREEKNRISKQRLFWVAMSIGVQFISFILQAAKIFEISAFYDLTMPGELFGTVFMLIGILGFDLMGTREIAKDLAIDRISEGIIAVDNNGRIRYYNEPAAGIFPQFKAFFGSNNYSTMKNVISGSGDSSSEQILTPYDIISTISNAVSTEGRLTAGERIYTVEENDLLHKSESYGKLYSLVDDTEHYRFMEELKRQKEIADRANEAKSRFLAGMSHEIRTPINAVLGMDEMILRESKEKSIRSYAADIMSAGRTLLSLINDILDLSKVEEGKMEIIPVQYDLSVFISDLSNMIRERAEKKGLEFNIKADEHIPHLLTGDEIRIRQCAMNLLTNAVKYTDSGEVRLEIAFKKTGEEHILLKFTVNDTGIGMKQEDMEDLFSPYKRIEEKRNRNIEGTGLGMSITMQLLKLMGSTLEVHSEYGRGSVFSFELDQKVVKWEELGEYTDRLSDVSGSSYEYHELFHAPKARIMVVDDTEMNLTVIQGLLKKTGIQIDTASSGREAAELAGDNSYDVIFIDHMMPDMDGIETLNVIRSKGANRNTPAVALTANAVSGARKMYLDAGFSDYLSKPVDGTRLEKMLLEMLPKDRLAEDYEYKTVSAEESNTQDLPKELYGITEIDKETGIINCGSKDAYLSVLSVFHQTAAAKADEIEKYYHSGDIENYTVKVHALKSSARIIGADSLSELAGLLEDAGKNNDPDFIRENTGNLLDKYRKLDTMLSCLEKKDDNLPEISSGELKEAYQTILEIAGSMDYGMMDSMLKDLRCYRLPKEDDRRISVIEEKFAELDWDGIKKGIDL